MTYGVCVREKSEENACTYGGESVSMCSCCLGVCGECGGGDEMTGE